MVYNSVYNVKAKQASQ